jgi:hypothetical protein
MFFVYGQENVHQSGPHKQRFGLKPFSLLGFLPLNTILGYQYLHLIQNKH